MIRFCDNAQTCISSHCGLHSFHVQDNCKHGYKIGLCSSGIYQFCFEAAHWQWFQVLQKGRFHFLKVLVLRIYFWHVLYPAYQQPFQTSQRLGGVVRDPCFALKCTSCPFSNLLSLLLLSEFSNYLYAIQWIDHE